MRAPAHHTRAFPRVQYPSALRPYLLLGDEIGEVVDCSERGIRFGGLIELPKVGDTVEGQVHFRSGVVVRVRGAVVRIQTGEVAVHLQADWAIPGSVIEAEIAASAARHRGA